MDSDDDELDNVQKSQDMSQKPPDCPAIFLMKLINHNGNVIEKKLVQHLANKNYAQLVDPACRLLTYFFKRAPDL